ncbi:MAG: GumC family protein [Vicinamibacterales bacterium]
MTDFDSLDQPAPAPPQVSARNDAASPLAVPLRLAPASADAANGYAQEERDIHIADYLRALYKRRYLALTVFSVIVGLVTIRTLMATPMYEATTRLLIDADTPNVVTFEEVVNEQEARSDYYLTQYNILESRSLARRVLDKLNLWDHPYIGGAVSPAGFADDSLLGRAQATVMGWLGRSTPPDTLMLGASDETTAQTAALDAFLSRLTIAPLRNSRLVDITYQSPDPTLASSIANTLAVEYIAQTLEFRFMASQEATGFLTERLEDQRRQVQAAEEALQRYREQNDAISLEGSENIVVQKLADLNAALTRAKTTRLEREAVYEQLRRNRDNAAVIDTFPAIMANGFIQNLKAELATLQRQKASLSEKFLASHPQMVAVNTAITNTEARLKAEVDKVVLSVKSEFDAAVVQEQSLATALNQQKSEALAMNEKSIEYNVLAREVESSRQIYDSLMQRSKETGVSGELRTSNIRVVDAAERPQAPAYPQVRLNLLGGVFGGAMAAVLLALLFDYADNRIKNPEEIRTFLGLSHLGLLPLMSKSDAEGYVRLDRTVPANFSEAFRVLRTNVLFSGVNEGGQSLLVTSTGPGEGKSLVASNLAISLAQAGRRVLLIDADMRKPKAQLVFDLPQEPGLSNLLVGEAKASQCVRKSGTDELWVLPAGRIPPNPAELLGSKRFKDFLASLKTHFDWVIVDTPPVMAVADVSIIAQHVSGALFVVGAEMTNRHAARQAVQQLNNVHARLIGAVLNRVDLERNSYYYSQYYRREYTSYYVKAG